MLETYKVTGEWFGRLEELVEDIEDKGYEVLDSNAEYITFIDPEGDGTEYVAYLGGTERTIYIRRIEENSKTN